uniref:CSON011305 protein n=1 Tax=Culicoides sonorensis TaxID=179676 RepID=A0A336LRG3_CULSO
MKSNILMIVSILIAYGYANPVPDIDQPKENPTTTVLPETENESLTTLANESSDQKVTVDDTEQFSTVTPEKKQEMVEEKTSDVVEKQPKEEEEENLKEKSNIMEKSDKEIPVENTPLALDKPKALLEERKDNTIEEKKNDEPSLVPNPEDHNSTSIKEKRADLPAEPEADKTEATVAPSETELEKTTVPASTPKSDDSSESKESEESAESKENN